MNTEQLTRVICSDCDYDQLCADIYLNRKFICRLSWEDGPKLGKVEFRSFQEGVVMLDAFQFINFLEESFDDLTSSKMNEKLIDMPDLPEVLKVSLGMVEQTEISIQFGSALGGKLTQLNEDNLVLTLCDLPDLDQWRVDYSDFIRILKSAAAKI